MHPRCIVVALSLVCAPLYASDPADAGLDLVLLVDRSRSMAGEPIELLPALAAGIVARNGTTNGLNHRLGVVSFGSDARVDRALSPVVNRDVHLLADAFSGGTRGNTNVLAAFEAAAPLFAALPYDSARRRAVVLITDGVSNVPGTDFRAYESALRRFITSNFSRATIDVVLVRSSTARDRYLWHELAAGRVHETRRHESVAAVLHRITTALVGSSTLEAPIGHQQTLVLPPYLNVVVFDVVGLGAREVAVFAPGARQPLKEGTDGIELVRVGETVSTFVVHHPSPGPWQFRTMKPDLRVQVFAQKFLPRGTLMTPLPAQRLKQHDRVVVGYQIVDQDGRPFAEIPGYPLFVELQMTTPEGQQVLEPMSLSPALGPAVYAARSDQACDVPGRYWTEVRVKTHDARQQLVEVFRDRWSGFSVMPAALVDCRLFCLPVERLLWSPRVEMRLDCLPAHGDPHDMPVAPADAFRGSLQRNGKAVAADVRFESRGKGAFAGVLKGARIPGSYTLRLAVDRSRMAAAYNIRIVPSELSFTRAVAWQDAALCVLLLAGTAAVGGLLIAGRGSRTNRPA